MSLVNDNQFDINSIKPKEIDETIDKFHKEFIGKTGLNGVCPACESEEYTFAFDKYKFHYVECCRCKSLYVQNSIAIEEYHKYTQMLVDDIYTTKNYQNYLNELSTNNPFNLELTLSRFLNKKNLLNVAYMGNKAKVFQTALGCFNTAFTIINEASDMQENYDLIILDHYLEKSADLNTLMKTITSSLNKNAFLYISSRVGSGIDILTLWEDTKLYPLEHQNLLSIDGIKIMLKKYDFSIKELNTPGTLDVNNILNSNSQNIPKFLHYLFAFEKENALEDFRVFIQRNLLSSFATVIAQKG